MNKIKRSIYSIALISLLPAFANASVVAKIGSRDITSDEVKKEYEYISKEQRKTVNEDYMSRKAMVDNVVNSELLLQAATNAGYDKEEEYKKAIERYRKQYLSTKYMEKEIEPKLDKSEVKKFFEANKSGFDSTQACANHIVVQTEDEAKRVLAMAKAKGAKFADLAKKYSIDPTVQENKGNLGCFTRDRMVPEFAMAAFTMKKGEVRGPVRTIYGFHIIQVYDTKLGKAPTFEESEQRAKEAYRMKLIQEMISGLRTKSSVKLNEEEIRNFKL